MKTPKSAFSHTPFEKLSDLLKQKNIELPETSTTPEADTKSSGKCLGGSYDPETDRKLFLEAMADVVPIEKNKHVYPSAAPSPNSSPVLQESESELKLLEQLIKTGEGFSIFHTDEYMEGAANATHPELTRYLHAGRFTIQDHIDLHGLNLADAKHAFDNFLKRAITTKKKGVLIVHGRGLSSPNEPVLKNSVYQWLSSGQWRRWVVAFASARPCDGGAGATYVLLRAYPSSKRQRKTKRSVTR